MINQPKSQNDASFFQFERDIERALDDLRDSETEREALTSIVWVSATVDGTSSQIVVVDAHNRSEILALFTVSADRLTALCSVPGAQPSTDYASRPSNLRKATAVQSSVTRCKQLFLTCQCHLVKGNLPKRFTFLSISTFGHLNRLQSVKCVCTQQCRV